MFQELQGQMSRSEMRCEGDTMKDRLLEVHFGEVFVLLQQVIAGENSGGHILNVGESVVDRESKLRGENAHVDSRHRNRSVVDRLGEVRAKIGRSGRESDISWHSHVETCEDAAGGVDRGRSNCRQLTTSIQESET